MATGFVVRGSIKDTNGHPLKNLMIQAMDSDQEWFDDRSDDMLGMTRVKNDGSFEITFSEEQFKENSSSKIEITNLLGQQVFSEEAKISTGENTKQIKTTDLPDGVYTLKISGAEKNQYQKIIIQK